MLISPVIRQILSTPLIWIGCECPGLTQTVQEGRREPALRNALPIDRQIDTRNSQARRVDTADHGSSDYLQLPCFEAFVGVIVATPGHVAPGFELLLVENAG